MSSFAPDRRLEPRADIAVPLHLYLPDLDTVLTGLAVNISRSGMFIPMESPPEPGTHIHVNLSTAEELLLDAVVEVVRSVEDGSGSGVGVRFVDISFGAEALIDRVLADENSFGDYRIKSLLGQGGMAEVYRARDLSSDQAGREVALKRILPRLARDIHFARLFRKEAGITRRLRHPHIIRVYDVGEIRDTVYIAMELVDGCHLGQLITLCAARRAPPPPEVVAYVGHAVAGALHYAHGIRDHRGKLLGLVHRDVTPSNLFLSRTGEVKLGDFGIALVHGGRGEGNGGRVGKDQYMAPEQLLGAPATRAADVYSLGATLFEALTSRPAFQDDANAKLRLPPPDVRTVRAEVPEPLALAVMRAMSPLPADASTRPEELAHRFAQVTPRFANAGVFATALANAFDPAQGNSTTVASLVNDLIG